MSELRPQPLAVLLSRALAEHGAQRSIFDLPQRSFWRGLVGFDLSTEVQAERAATPIGPAAGPHTQLAQNLVVAWLAGARVLELKTVQRNDRLSIPRPCIDVSTIGFNVEWSQELKIEDSTHQYLAAWLIIHALGARGLVGPDGSAGTRFEASVGYDLQGLRSAPMARFLDTLVDARQELARLRDTLPPVLGELTAGAPDRVVSCVTLSTFHGCPPEQIERIVEHLIERHGVSVVIKFNPTLLGFETVDELLRRRMGYREIRLDRAAFDRDLPWDAALGLVERLGGVARRAGVHLGAKFTNTLVVKNHKQVFRDPVMYLSGQPLHVLAIVLADRFARATQGRIPVSFSAGIDAGNVSEAVACGFRPVTMCTDLLRPTGYRRLPVYLKAIITEMERLGVRSLNGLIHARATEAGLGSSAAGAPDIGEAARRFLAAYAARVTDDPRYHAAANRTPPRRSTTSLALLDCESCNNCLVVCPNDAMFQVRVAPQSLGTWDLAIAGGMVEHRPARFEIREEKQWVSFADFCNACGNCDVFCPEQGGPFRIKPRFFGSREAYQADPDDGILLEEGGGEITARLGGREHHLKLEAGGARFGDGVIEARLDAAHHPVEVRVIEPHEGHTLALARYHALRLLCRAVLERVNAVSASLARLPARG